MTLKIIFNQDKKLFSTNEWRIYGCISASVQKLFDRFAMNKDNNFVGFTIGMSVPT